MGRGGVRFTEDQYRYARDRANALDYAQARGYELIKSGSCYRLKQHDSMVFLPDGRWFWNSRGLRGRAIEFVMAYEDKSLPEAVLALCSLAPARLDTTTDMELIKAKKEFVLPPRASDCRRLFAYLCETRCLDKDIIRELVKSGDLYESARSYTDRTTGDLRCAHNAVFVGRIKGEPKSAFQRGLSSFAGSSAFKRDVAGSDPAAPFLLPGREGIDTVVVFEAAIDAISHATLYKLAGRDYKSCDRIAQGGNGKYMGLTTYLKEHPATRKIIIAYDKDAGGEAGFSILSNNLSFDGYQVLCLRQPEGTGKDWNDFLCQKRNSISAATTSK